MKLHFFRALSKHPERLMFLTILLLLIAGVLFVFDASVAEAFYQFGDKYYFAKQQVLWAGLGLLALIVCSFVPVKVWKMVSSPVFFLSLGLLALVLLPGIGTTVQGAQRWIVYGGFRFQPAELAKLAVIFYFPTWLIHHQRIGPFAFFTTLLFGLLLFQPDLGTALVLMAICVGLYVSAGGSWKYIVGFGGVGILGVLLIVLVSPYRMQRITAFLNPETDPLGASYHIRQITIALGSGGLFGQGIGQSRQKYQYIPEASTDSIFAIAAEEIGFIGALVMLGLFSVVFIQGFAIAEKTKDPYEKLVATGIVIWVTSQTILNLGSIVALVPLTGVPLPFISYGGSSLISLLAGSGILIGVGRRTA